MKRTMTPRQNFVICMVEAQLLGSAELQTGGLDYPRIAAALRGLNVFFTVAFAVELALNMFSHWLHPFLRDGSVTLSPRRYRRPVPRRFSRSVLESGIDHLR